MANVFTEKIGPLPTWAWMGIATVVILGVVALRKKNSSSTDTTAQQQALASEEAALANAAGSSAAAGNASPGTYGSGFGNFTGNGYAGNSSGLYSTYPAASTTAPQPAATGTTPATTSTATAPAPVTQSVPPRSTAPAPAAAWNNTYVVRKGDTLASVAAKFHTTVAQVASHNVYAAGEAPGKAAGTPLGTGAGLKTGQVLIVP